MFWINPYSQRNQRHRFLCRRKDSRADVAAQQLSVKYDGQPRDESGRYSFGRRDGDAPKEPGLVSAPAFLRTPVRPPLRSPLAAPADVSTALQAYRMLSGANGPDARAVLGFNAGAFEPGAGKGDAAVHVGMLNRDEVDNACPRYREVQSITNQAASLIDRGAYPTQQAYGTAVHLWIRDEVNGRPTIPESPPEDPNFRAELSVLKSDEARYGDPGSKRVDVYENPHTGTVCIYDIKTGEAGLNFARMRELATNVGTFYPGTTRIIVTEVRPQR